MTKTGCWALVFRAVLLSALVPVAGAGETAPGGTLKLAVAAYHAKQYPAAIEGLTEAARTLPQLADYTAYYLASARSATGDWPGVVNGLHALAGQPATAVTGKALLLLGRAYLERKDAGQAVSTLREGYRALPQPDGDLLLAEAYELRREPVEAAALYQRVWGLYAASEAAVTAGGAMARLRTKLGKDYPPAPAKLLLARGETWMAQRNFAKARVEYGEIIGQVSGAERDAARVRMAAASCLAGDARTCKAGLEHLSLALPEADAERLYYLAEANRKLNNEAAAKVALDLLGKRYGESPWLMKGLLSAGNHYLAARDTARYTPLFTAAYRRFPHDPATAPAHWRVAWDAYRAHAPNAGALLEEQVRGYPQDPRAAGALYFLGRRAEQAQDACLAMRTYRAVSRLFPNYYYGVLAEAKLAGNPAGEKCSVPPAFLSSVTFAERVAWSGEAPGEVAAAHVERSRLLQGAGLPEWAEAELRYGMRPGIEAGQKRLLTLELARQSPSAAVALRHLKMLAPDALLLPLEGAPQEFWRFLFPLPYREQLLESAKAQGVDPYLLAGLIRQESEFNPAAVSRANALGLTQLLPSTGRMVAQSLRMGPFRGGLLFHPEISLKLGAEYLRTQLLQWNNQWEPTLAAYNAGPSRVREWLAAAQGQDAAEFVENIPFTETREYVQAVMRNASLYKRLYAGAQ